MLKPPIEFIFGLCLTLVLGLKIRGPNLSFLFGLGLGYAMACDVASACAQARRIILVKYLVWVADRIGSL